MIVAKTAAILLGVALTASAQSASCSSYVLINARGTGEPQGESSGFRTMNDIVEREVSGGDVYNVVYPAGANQDSSDGTEDIINEVQSRLSADPSTCVILEGYSQGAAAVVNAMRELDGASFEAVKAAVLLGNPVHKPRLACNVDENGGRSTYFSRGISGFAPGIPSEWVSKTLDICWNGDGVCDRRGGFGITPEHLRYPASRSVQSLGSDFIVEALQEG